MYLPNAAWAPRLRNPTGKFLDHAITIEESQIRRVIWSYVDYDHPDRTHLGLEKDSPEERPIVAASFLIW